MNKIILFLCIGLILVIPTVQAEEFISICYNGYDVRVVESKIEKMIYKGAFLGTCEEKPESLQNFAHPKDRAGNIGGIIQIINKTINGPSEIKKLQDEIDTLKIENMNLFNENVHLKKLLYNLYDKIDTIYEWVLIQ